MKTITVKGVGSVSAKADYIHIFMTVEDVNREYAAAMTTAAHRIEKLQEAVVSCGYQKEDLKTVHFQVDTRHESIRDRNGDYRREFAGYECRYRLKLGFDFDSKQLAKVMEAIAHSNVHPELQIQFTVKDPAKVSEDLLRSAAENARTKAEILCRASSAKLGPLVSINYNWGELDIISRTSYEMGDCMPMMAESRLAPDIEPDDIDLTDSVTFVWEIQ